MRRDEIFLHFVFASLSGQKRGPGVSADDAQKKSAEPIGSALRGFVTSLGELRDDLGGLRERRQGDGREQSQCDGESGEFRNCVHLISLKRFKLR